MPYKSIQQEKWAHTADGTKALGGPEKVKQWDTASKGLKIPQRVPLRKKAQKRTDVVAPARMS